MSDTSFAKWVVLVSGAVPVSLLGWDAWNHELGANPVNFAIRTTGLLALIFLLLTLAITPVAKLTGWNRVTHFRRLLGVYAFVYTALHFAIFVVFDRDLSISSTIYEITSRLYLTIGAAGLLMMLPLAVTSTDGMIKRIGAARWKLLHRLTYLAAIAGVVHYFLLVKADIRSPAIFAALLGVLFLYRMAAHYAKLSRFYRLAQDKPTAFDASAPSAIPQVSSGRWSGPLVVTHIAQETSDVRTFRFASPEGGPLPFTHLPGQFLTFSLTIEGAPVKRTYTIASTPSRSTYCEVTIKREERGLVSRFLHDTIRVGDRIQVTAPGGKFTFTGETAGAIVLIAGGVGITPLMSKVRYLTDRAWPGHIYLIYSNKTEEDIIFREEIAYLQKRHANLHVCLTLSRAPESSWIGERGRISWALLERHVPNLHQHPIHICGPNELNQAVKALLLEAGISPERIHQESFGPSKSKGVERETSDAPSAEPATIHFARSRKTAPIPSGVTVLEAAERLGVALDSDCRAGICGSCKVRLLSGRVAMDCQDALEPADRAANRILSCQARCLDSVSIDA